MTEQHFAAAVCSAHNSNQRPSVLPYCDQCEDDHPSRVAADGAIECSRDAGSTPRYRITTAHHPTPAPCDHCATVAPLFRVADDWICALCHNWDERDAAIAAASLPARPCADCDAPQHCDECPHACHRCRRPTSSPWIMSTPDGEYVPVCDECAGGIR